MGRWLLSALMLDSGNGAHSDMHSDGALVRLCPFLTFASFHLFPLSGFDVGTDSLTDAVCLSLEVLNTQERVRLR